MVLECFDRSSGHPVVTPKLRDKAYLSAKAFLHLAVQHKCVNNKSDKMVFNSISDRHQITGHKCYEGDSDLEHTFGTIDRVFGDFESMHHQNFSLTALRHAWMGRTLLYHTWDVIIGECEPLPDDIDEFILHSLRLELLSLAPIVADSVSSVWSLELIYTSMTCWLLTKGELTSYSIYVCNTELSHPVIVAKSVLRSTGSSTSLPRFSRIPPPLPKRSTVLWRPWNALLRYPRTASPRRIITYSMSLCRLPSLSRTLGRRNGMLLVSPCMAPTSGTSPCHRSRIFKTFLHSLVITSTLLPGAVKIRMSQFRMYCARWRTPLVLSQSRLSRTSIRRSPPSFVVSATCTRTASRSSFAGLLISSSLSSVTGCLTLPSRSWHPIK